MNLFRLFAGIGCLALLLAERSALAESELPNEPGKDFVHKLSGFKFTPTVGGFRRTSVHRYDDAGLDVSAGYQRDGSPIVITVYVYACQLRSYGADLEKEFEDCEAGIRAKHDGVTSVAVGPVKLVQGDRTFNGRKGVYLLKHFGGTGGKATSELYLFIHEKNYIEYRISYPPGSGKADEDAIAAFMETLKWP